MIAIAPAVNIRLAQDLDAVAELVARGPCVGTCSLDADGHKINVLDPRAVRWCPMGATMRVTRNQPNGDWRYMEVMDALHHELGPTLSIASWADAHPWDEVVALCRRAAMRARGVL